MAITLTAQEKALIEAALFLVYASLKEATHRNISEEQLSAVVNEMDTLVVIRDKVRALPEVATAHARTIGFVN